MLHLIHYCLRQFWKMRGSLKVNTYIPEKSGSYLFFFEGIPKMLWATLCCGATIMWLWSHFKGNSTSQIHRITGQLPLSKKWQRENLKRLLSFSLAQKKSTISHTTDEFLGAKLKTSRTPFPRFILVKLQECNLGISANVRENLAQWLGF